MPNLVTQFNSVASGVTQLVGENTVAVQVNIPQTKRLTGIQASLAVFAGVGTVVPQVQGRLLVCTGSLTFENNGTNNVQGGPLTTRALNLPTGTARVLLDLDFFDVLNLDFSDPFVVSSDEILTALIGLTITYQNGAVGVGDPAVVRLVMKGFTGEKAEAQSFPYRLR